MYKLIIFDFDGTIADTFQLFFDLVKEVSEDLGLEKELTKEDVKKYRRQGVAKVIKELGIKPWQIPSLIKKGQELLKGKIKKAEPFAGIPEILKKLSRKTTLGIITTNSAENAEAFLEKHRLNFFDFVISSPALFGKSKLIEQVIEEYKLDKTDLIYVGDEVRDIENAQKAGIKVAAVSWGYNDKELLASHNPDFLLETPSDLKRMLE